MRPTDGRRRVVIEGVDPEIDGGRFPIKRVAGDRVVVEADVFADGHDTITATLLHRRADESSWVESQMQPLVNDRWRGSFPVPEIGRYQYTVRGGIDEFGTWAADLAKRVEAGQDVSVDLEIGAEIVDRASRRATGEGGRLLRKAAVALYGGTDRDVALAMALDPEVAALMRLHASKRNATAYGTELEVVVDRERARFGAWYELFPRSTSPLPKRNGTFADVEARVPYVAEMGFDVLYLPPVHPIGRSHRKGRNNSTVPEAGAPGSPWAIGSEEGGHTAVHPDLGTMADFDHLVSCAERHGLEVALDLAFQCSPDHPWVREHPEWFRHRPDGTVQYAENPPKKYQDIYPLNFDSEAWWELWQALEEVTLFWIAHGVRIFRVDNPHTKPFRFWEWLIGKVKAQHPDVIFLSEAFTRPRIMYRLAKGGFSQSYTYFAWRNTKWELTEYFRELTQTEVREYFRANLWPNTPDIITEQLRSGGRPAFLARLILAATLGASYGIYGPAYELMEHLPVEEGREEYLDSEKYEIRSWDLDRTDSLADLIGLVNRIRHEQPALHDLRTLRFHHVDNEELIAYSKTTDDASQIVLTVVNLDPHHRQSGWVTLPLEDFGLEAQKAYQVHDLLTGSRYLWHGPTNFVQLDPEILPAHILRVRHKLRSERDFEYFA